MKNITLNIGDVAVGKRDNSYTCFGLGSCIGLFLQDRITGISGGAHILLPQGGEVTDGKYYSVYLAIEELLRRLKSFNAGEMALRAKIAGGANVIGASLNVGQQNIDQVIGCLSAHKIFIAAMDVGGNQSRTVCFEAATGQLSVRKANSLESKIY